MKKSRIFIITLLALFGMSLTFRGTGNQEQTAKANISVLAKTSSSSRGGSAVVELNDGLTPNRVPDGMRQRPGNANSNRRPQRLSAQWVQYDWVSPVTINETAIFLYNFDNLAKLPQAYRFKYWDGILHRRILWT